MTIWHVFLGMVVTLVTVVAGFVMGRVTTEKPIVPERPPKPERPEDYDDCDDDPFNVAAYGSGVPIDEMEGRDTT